MLDGIGNRNGHRVRDTSNAVNEASKRGGARQAGVSKFPHKNEKFRHSHVNGVSGHFLQESKMKFEQYLKDSDAEDYESDVSINIDDIFTVREKFTRKSKTAGAMREPLCTLTSQANMNKFVKSGASIQNSLVQLRSCTKVGDMYECPYCSKSFNATQGVKKAYNRHLSTKACQNKRVSLGASGESDGEVDDGDDGDRSIDGHDGISNGASSDADNNTAANPSKRRRK